MALSIRVTGEERLDNGLTSFLTGLGTRRDPLEQLIVTNPPVYSSLELDNFYRSFVPCQRVVNCIPDHMSRHWGTITLGGNASDPKLVQRINKAIEPLRSLYNRAEKEARLKGGAAIIRIVNDGRDWRDPIDESNIKSIEYSRVLDCFEIFPDLSDPSTDPLAPQRYYYQSGSVLGSDGQRHLWHIHRSRVIRFDGLILSTTGLRNNRGWGDSMLNGFIKSCQGYYSALSYAIGALKDFEVLNLKVSNLLEMLATEKGKQIASERLSFLIQGMSAINGVLSDKENEDLSYISRSYSGVKDIIEVALSNMVADSGLTRAQLLNEHPTGNLGSTGESMSRSEREVIEAAQESKWRPILEYDIKLLLLNKSGPTEGREPEDWGWKWHPLHVSTPEDIARLRLINAQIDQIYHSITDGLTGEEIIESRWGGHEYGTEIVLNRKAREEAKKRRQEKEANQDPNDPFGLSALGLDEKKDSQDNTVSVDGRILSESEYKDLAEIEKEDIAAALSDWKKTAPKRYQEILNADPVAQP